MKIKKIVLIIYSVISLCGCGNKEAGNQINYHELKTCNNSNSIEKDEFNDSFFSKYHKKNEFYNYKTVISSDKSFTLDENYKGEDISSIVSQGCISRSVFYEQNNLYMYPYEMPIVIFPNIKYSTSKLPSFLQGLKDVFQIYGDLLKYGKDGTLYYGKNIVYYEHKLEIEDTYYINFSDDYYITSIDYRTSIQNFHYDLYYYNAEDIIIDSDADKEVNLDFFVAALIAKGNQLHGMNYCDISIAGDVLFNYILNGYYDEKTDSWQARYELASTKRRYYYQLIKNTEVELTAIQNLTDMIKADMINIEEYKNKEIDENSGNATEEKVDRYFSEINSRYFSFSINSMFHSELTDQNTDFHFYVSPLRIEYSRVYSKNTENYSLELTEFGLVKKYTYISKYNFEYNTNFSCVANYY